MIITPQPPIFPPQELKLSSKDLWRLAFSKMLGLQDLQTFADELKDQITQKSPFVLWLHGEMGSGKTTLTQALMHSLGVPASLKVLSPTYTYMSEYKTLSGDWLAHLDFYRADHPCHPEDLGLVDIRDYRGYIVEWPTQMIPDDPLKPSSILCIGAVASERTYTLWIKD